jgi:hypothetical protein
VHSVRTDTRKGLATATISKSQVVDLHAYREMHCSLNASSTPSDRLMYVKGVESTRGLVTGNFVKASCCNTTTTDATRITLHGVVIMTLPDGSCAIEEVNVGVASDQFHILPCFLPKA